MVNIKLILDSLEEVKGVTGLEVIDRAKGKYQLPRTPRDVIKMLKYRYSG